MDWIGLLTGKRDITRDWHAQPGLPLEFDLDRHAFCGVRLGESIDGLQKLGPSDNRRVPRDRYLYYFSRGVEIGMEGDRFVWCGVIFNWQHWKGVAQPGDRPFAGRILLGGRVVLFSAATTEQEVRPVLGEPDERDGEPDDIVLTYHRDGHRYEIELTGDGKLASIAGFAPELG
jgi:hypothetical protein